MIEQLEKILENRTTVKNFNGNPIPNHLSETIKQSVTKTPSCDNRYNFKVKSLGQSREHRKAKIGLHQHICTLSKEDVRCNYDEDKMVVRSPGSYYEVEKWKDKGILSTQINGQVLAPLVLVWYFADGEPVENDYLDAGLSCWNAVLTAESLGVQTGFCSCFDKNYLKSFLDIDGAPAVMIGFGFAENTN